MAKFGPEITYANDQDEELAEQVALAVNPEVNPAAVELMVPARGVARVAIRMFVDSRYAAGMLGISLYENDGSFAIERHATPYVRNGSGVDAHTHDVLHCQGFIYDPTGKGAQDRYLAVEDLGEDIFAGGQTRPARLRRMGLETANSARIPRLGSDILRSVSSAERITLNRILGGQSPFKDPALRRALRAALYVGGTSARLGSAWDAGE